MPTLMLAVEHEPSTITEPISIHASSSVEQSAPASAFDVTVASEAAVPPSSHDDATLAVELDDMFFAQPTGGSSAAAESSATTVSQDAPSSTVTQE